MSYEILNLIGQGTYGVVSKARNSQNKEIVALKSIKFETREDGIPSSAIREIALLKELKHPNVIQLFDVIHSQRQLTLVFEYCECDLYRYMTHYINEYHTQTIPEDQTILFSYQLLSALSYIHSNSIIHRDVKPHNLLIRNNELKLADFGLARSTYIPVNQDSVSTEVVTQWYRPPELLLDIHDYSYPVDVWSAGCVIFEMMTGQPLFPFKNNEEMIEAACHFFGYSKFCEAFPNHTQSFGIYKDEKGCGLSTFFEGCNEKLIDLVTLLLDLNPEHRITAVEALNHPVFNNMNKNQ